MLFLNKWKNSVVNRHLLNMKIIKTLCCFLLVSLCSCWQPASEITDEILGTYAFEFPRGDYQLLEVNKDSSFVQKLYINKDSLENKTPPFYVNKGRWSIIKGRELRFNDWLEYCYLRYTDSILPHPKQVDMGNVYWNESTRNYNSYITIFDDTGYYFVKMDEKEITKK